MDICLSLCYRVKELKRAREHESDRKSPLTMWYHSPDSSFLFRFYPRHFTSERWGKQNIPPALRLLLLLQCYWLYYYYMYNSIFSHIYSFHWLDFGWRVTTPTGLWTTKGYGLGGRGRGVQDICFMAFFALFHGLLCLFWIQREGQRGQQDMSVEIWRDAEGGRSRRSQRIGRPCRNTLGSNCTSYFLSDQWIHFKIFFFFFLLDVLVTHSSSPPFPCTAVDGPTLSLVQHFLLSHCPLPHQSAHMGGATNECSWWFIHAKA